MPAGTLDGCGVANRNRRANDLLLLLTKRVESSNVAHAAVIFQSAGELARQLIRNLEVWRD
jgi:hypothetical protein